MLLLILTLLCGLTFCLFCGATCGEMREAVMMAYELGCSLLPWTAVMAVCLRRRRKQGLALVSGTRWLWMALFGVYVALTFQVTGAGTLYEALAHGVEFTGGEVNLAPFSQGIDPVGYVLNVVLCMPLGFFLPLLWDAWDHPGKVLGAGAAFSLLIELSQLCNIRATDVDDLLLNTLGALLGWLLFRLFLQAAQWKREQVLQWPMGPGATVGMLFLGRFLLYQGSWMAWLLYGGS